MSGFHISPMSISVTSQRSMAKSTDSTAAVDRGLSFLQKLHDAQQITGWREPHRLSANRSRPHRAKKLPQCVTPHVQFAAQTAWQARIRAPCSRPANITCPQAFQPFTPLRLVGRRRRLWIKAEAACRAATGGARGVFVEGHRV